MFLCNHISEVTIAAEMRESPAVLLLILALSGCAPGPNPVTDGPGTPAGFWLGLWHGMISFITFIISLFNENVGVYEAYNTGGWYNFGFVLGVSSAYGGSSSVAK